MASRHISVEFLICLSLAAKRTGKAHGSTLLTLLRLQNMVHVPHPVSSSQRWGKLQLFFSKSLHFLKDAWFLLLYQSPYASPWVLIEFYSTRMNYARLLLRINSVDFGVFSSSDICIVENYLVFVFGSKMDGANFVILPWGTRWRWLKITRFR